MEAPKRFYSLDVLRGLAALAVVFWHWQHFFMSNSSFPFDTQQQPFYTLFSLFYQRGAMAVDLFFCLSGFIFFWLYKSNIENGRVGGRTFFLLRLSRLYPLHLLTLIVVAVGQYWTVQQWGRPFVYPSNDPTHFFLQLFFASAWGLEKGYSFNGPIWSVSVEFFLYALFFFLARRGGLGFRKTLVFVLVGIAMRGFNVHLARGIHSFFIGGLTYLTYHQILINKEFRYKKWALGGFALLTSIWILLFSPVQIHFAGVGIIKNLFVIDFIFPLTILVLALIETRRGTVGKRLAFLGDISYSSYLWHFPLQLAFIHVTSAWHRGLEFYYSPLSLGLFFAVLLVVSHGSYRFYERPIQTFLRKRFELRGS